MASKRAVLPVTTAISARAICARCAFPALSDLPAVQRGRMVPPRQPRLVERGAQPPWPRRRGLTSLIDPAESRTRAGAIILAAASRLPPPGDAGVRPEIAPCLWLPSAPPPSEESLTQTQENVNSRRPAELGNCRECDAGAPSRAMPSPICSAGTALKASRSERGRRSAAKKSAPLTNGTPASAAAAAARPCRSPRAARPRRSSRRAASSSGRPRGSASRSAASIASRRARSPRSPGRRWARSGRRRSRRRASPRRACSARCTCSPRAPRAARPAARAAPGSRCARPARRSS